MTASVRKKLQVSTYQISEPKADFQPIFKHYRIVLESIQLYFSLVYIFTGLLYDCQKVRHSILSQIASLSSRGQLFLSCLSLKLSNDQKLRMDSSWLAKADVTVDGTENLSWYKSVFCSYLGNILLLCVIEARVTSKDLR